MRANGGKEGEAEDEGTKDKGVAWEEVSTDWAKQESEIEQRKLLAV